MSKQSKIAAMTKQVKVVVENVQKAKTAVEKKAARKQLTDYLSGK